MTGGKRLCFGKATSLGFLNEFRTEEMLAPLNFLSLTICVFILPVSNIDVVYQQSLLTKPYSYSFTINSLAVKATDNPSYSKISAISRSSYEGILSVVTLGGTCNLLPSPGLILVL